MQLVYNTPTIKLEVSDAIKLWPEIKQNVENYFNQHMTFPQSKSR